MFKLIEPVTVSSNQLMLTKIINSEIPPIPGKSG
jgi:hypothetical protein